MVMTVAEQIARRILEQHAAAYWAANLPDSTETVRRRIIESAAQQIQPFLDKEVSQALEAVATNPT